MCATYVVEARRRHKDLQVPLVDRVGEHLVGLVQGSLFGKVSHVAWKRGFVQKDEGHQHVLAGLLNLQKE